MREIRALWQRYREVLTYLIFGGLTTLVNIAAFMLLLEGAGMPTDAANALALALSILFAYLTNRRWVFRSNLRGMAAFREFLMFIACRLATGVLDQIIVVLGVDHLGPGLIAPELMKFWSLGVKVFANIIVIIANYVFSKLIIFKKKQN